MPHSSAVEPTKSSRSADAGLMIASLRPIGTGSPILGRKVRHTTLEPFLFETERLVF